jgi:hypothetical protein
VAIGLAVWIEEVVIHGKSDAAIASFKQQLQPANEIVVCQSVRVVSKLHNDQS